MTLEYLVNRIENLKDSIISKTINNRIKEFKDINRNSNEDLFKELCFCILTANFSAERSIKIHEELSNCFLDNTESELAIKLRNMGVKIKNIRPAEVNN